MTVHHADIGILYPDRMRRQWPDDVADAMRARGRSVAVLADGDPAAMRMSATVIMGQPRAFRKTGKLLERAGLARPPTLLWLWEPLPPPDLPGWARALGVALSPATLGVNRAKAITRPLTWPVYVGLGRLGLSRFGRDSLDVKNLRLTFENLAFVLRGIKRGWITKVGVSTVQKQRYLAALGLDPVFVPVGQQASFGRILDRKRDIDVLFIGQTSSPSRRRKLDASVSEMERLGLRVVVSTDAGFGDERTELVNRAKVMLHVHHYPWDTPWMRWNLASANGAAMVSEPLSDPEPLIPGTDYLEAEIDGLPQVVCDLVNQDGVWETMAGRCAAKLETEMSFAQSIDRILRELDDMRRAG